MVEKIQAILQGPAGYFVAPAIIVLMFFFYEPIKRFREWRRSRWAGRQFGNLSRANYRTGLGLNRRGRLLIWLFLLAFSALANTAWKLFVN